jgi:hypothetical protein
MKTREWQNLFLAQAKFGKTLFTPTELANASGVTRRNLNVELTRLVKYGIVVRLAQGLYGRTGNAVPIDQMLLNLDPHAYITGHYALTRYGLATQAPAVITCFTNHRHFRREVPTPAGRLNFLCIKEPIYRRETRTIAGPEQALCDFVYIALRRGQGPDGLLTFRRMNTLKRSTLDRILRRYPGTVRKCVGRLAMIT